MDALALVTREAKEYRLVEIFFEVREPNAIEYGGTDGLTAVERTAEAVYSGAQEDIMAFIGWLSDESGQYFVRRVLLNTEPGGVELSSARIVFTIFGMDAENEIP